MFGIEMCRYLVFLILILEVNSKQWIDPHEMNLDEDLPKIIKINKNSSFRDKNHQEQSDTCPKNNAEIVLYMKRFVNLIVMSMEHENTENNVNANIKGTINFDITHENMKFLLEFSKLTSINSSKLRELDSVLTNSIQTSFFSSYAIKNFFKQSQDLIFNESVHFYLIISLIILFSFMCYKNKTSITNILLYMAFGTFLISVYLIYLHEVQKNDNLNDTACQPISWWDYLFGEPKDCKKLQKTQIFLNVVGDIVKGLIVKPLNFIGIGLGEFTSHLFGGLSFLQKLFIGPPVLILTFGLAFFVICLFMGKTIDFNFLHIFGVRLHNPKLRNVGSRGIDPRVEEIDEKRFGNKKRRKSPKQSFKDKLSSDKVDIKQKAISNRKLEDKSENHNENEKKNEDKTENHDENIEKKEEKIESTSTKEHVD